MSFPRRKLLLGVCAAVTVLIPALRTTVLSFALALFLAGCLQRPMIRLQRRGVPRVISAPAFLLLGLVPLIAMLAGGIFYGLRGVQQLAGTLLPLLGTRPAGEDWLYRLITALPPSVQDVCFAMLDKLAGRGDALAGELLQRLALWSSEALTALPKKWAVPASFCCSFCSAPSATRNCTGCWSVFYRRTGGSGWVKSSEPLPPGWGCGSGQRANWSPSSRWSWPSVSPLCGWSTGACWRYSSHWWISCP